MIRTDLIAQCRQKPRYAPLLALAGTDASFAILPRLPAPLIANGALDGQGKWLALIGDDDDHESLGPCAFDRSGISWLLTNANVFYVRRRPSSPQSYVRMAELACSGYRVVVIEAQFARLHEWIREITKLCDPKSYLMWPDEWGPINGVEGIRP